ncbi:hypothetical protein ABID29_001641 [Streptococcus rupicaprae]|uniref:Uncharacterized protein n=1 Tax=Streptococcus rupicaprae TaxID=759619 RepID=A0ABV2FJ84_9STRE
MNKGKCFMLLLPILALLGQVAPVKAQETSPPVLDHAITGEKLSSSVSAKDKKISHSEKSVVEPTEVQID